MIHSALCYCFIFFITTSLCEGSHITTPPLFIIAPVIQQNNILSLQSQLNAPAYHGSFETIQTDFSQQALMLQRYYQVVQDPNLSELFYKKIAEIDQELEQIVQMLHNVAQLTVTYEIFVCQQTIRTLHVSCNEKLDNDIQKIKHQIIDLLYSKSGEFKGITYENKRVKVLSCIEKIETMISTWKLNSKIIIANALEEIPYHYQDDLLFETKIMEHHFNKTLQALITLCQKNMFDEAHILLNYYQEKAPYTALTNFFAPWNYNKNVRRFWLMQNIYNDFYNRFNEPHTRT